MDGQVGGYPTKFLEQIVRLNKSLKQKKECINTLRYLVKDLIKNMRALLIDCKSFQVII
jgi:hypothetical protein